MNNGGDNHTNDEVERLRQALDSEIRRRLELQNRLDTANSDFEEFVSLAAHNLREPLRDVASFSQLMTETCASRLDSDTATFLERIQEGVARMQSLLTDVVDYWAAIGGELPSCRTDMEAVLRQALLSIEEQITERSATVTHDPLPMVMGDFGTLAKVLYHLIRNAIEYCGAPSPRVHISATREGLEWIFCVQDNGPGIDPMFQGRLFTAFRRLHGKEHPGSGLGLAFCKKAVEWHGGRMWMESAPGAGSALYFTLGPAQ